MVKLYEMPIAFWQGILGKGLHFHLGHFHTTETSLDDAMVVAVRNLAAQISPKAARRVLDIGCGWGGPAFELANIWDGEVFGLTVSKRQTEFINTLARVRNVPVRAMTVDAERFAFDRIGTFDVFWLYEALEHIVNRRSLFTNLHRASLGNAHLAITTTCRAEQVLRRSVYSEFLGVQLLETVSELIDILEEDGWSVSATTDCTALTLPVWDLWIMNLRRTRVLKYRDQSEKLEAEFSALDELYRTGILQSVQIVCSERD